MSPDISSVSQTSTLTSAISKIDMSKSDTEAKLKDLFDDKYFNGGEESRSDIQSRIDSLESLIKSYEKELKTYQDKITKIESQIDDKAGKLTSITTQISSETKAYIDDLEDAIKEAVANAINKTKQDTFSGNFKQSTFELNFQLELGKAAPNNSKISSMFNKQDAISAEIGDLCGEINTLIKDSGSMYRKVANTQATITLLTQTKNNMSQQISSLYSNKNNDSKPPVYSFEKEAFIAKLADDYNSPINARETNTQNTLGGETQSRRNEAEITRLQGEISGLSGNVTGSGDRERYAYGSEAMRGLETALFGEGNTTAAAIQEGSLVWQMGQAGASNEEIMDTLVSAFSNLGLSKNGNGTYGIPNGFGDGRWGGGRAGQIYTAVVNLANSTSNVPQPETTTPANSTDVNNATKAVQRMVNEKFTFKEAMFALTQLFPDLNLGYNLSEQPGTKEGKIKFSSDSSYDPLYNAIKSQTETGIWKNSIVERDPKPQTNTPLQVQRKDPVAIKDGDSRYYFVADTNNNGRYDGVNDLLGQQDGMNDFYTQYASLGVKEGQTVINNENVLKNMLVMKIEENDKHNGTVGAQQSFMSAWDAGIRSINLTPTNSGTSYNINNSEIQTEFSVTMKDGSKKEGQQSVDDANYLEATLNNKALTGSNGNIFSQLSTNTINRAFSNAQDGKLAEGFSGILERAQDAKKTVDRLTGSNGYDDIYSIEDAFRNHLDEVWEYADWLGKTTGAKIYAENVSEYNQRNYEYGYWENKKGEALNDTITDGIMDEVMKDPLGKRNDEYKK